MGAFDGHHNPNSFPATSSTARCAVCNNVSSAVGIALGNVHRGPDLFPSAFVLIPKKTLVFNCRSRVWTFPVASASVSRGAGVNGSAAVLIGTRGREICE